MQSWVYKQGEQRGTERTLRMAIAQVLEARGLRLTATRRAQLEAESRPEVLQSWHIRAITAKRVADVFTNGA